MAASSLMDGTPVGVAAALKSFSVRAFLVDTRACRSVEVLALLQEQALHQVALLPWCA